MKKVYSKKEINIGFISISDLKKINLKKLGLNKVNNPNQFVYNSDVFKILNYKVKAEINFLIFFKENNIYLELISIRGIPDLLNQIITIKIKVDIHQDGNSCKAKREISLYLKKENSFLRILSDKLINNLLSNALENISNRFDKKFLNKIINS